MDFSGLKWDTLLLDSCWICQRRFKTSKPPGPANREDHHIVPRNAGGTDGPQVRLCDSHHAVVHKVAFRLKAKKPYDALLVGEGSIGQTGLQRLLWLAHVIARAEASVVDDPNKLLRNGVSLTPLETAMIKRLQTIYKKSRPEILKIALHRLYRSSFPTQ